MIFRRKNIGTELLEQIEQLKAENDYLRKRAEKYQRKAKGFELQINRFKAFSPKLWFEYFSPNSGKMSNCYKASEELRKWVESERKQGRHL